jgi:ABC-type Fe3+/spermidine/putrescine transport system ATPase subunit
LKLTALHVTHDQEEAMSISDRVVVMKRGSIVETGSPLDLYLKPNNLFTANFVGEANFLVGIVEKILVDGSVVNLGKELQLQTNNKACQLGDRVVIAFRPEFASLVTESSKNQLSGKIREVLYSGSFARLKICLVNDIEVVIRVPLSNKSSEYSIGDEVAISLSPQYLLTYSYPTQGLTKTLSLE